jgi:hypothetical protein
MMSPWLRGQGTDRWAGKGFIRHLYLHLPFEMSRAPAVWEGLFSREITLRGLPRPMPPLDSLLITGGGVAPLGPNLVPMVRRLLGWSERSPIPVGNAAVEVDLGASPDAPLGVWWRGGIDRVVFRSMPTGSAMRLRERLPVPCGSFSVTLRIEEGSVSRLVQEALAMVQAGAASIALEESERSREADQAGEITEAGPAILELGQALHAAGWVQKDVAFFQRPGTPLLYPRALRRRLPILGLGPGAVSFHHPFRRWNPIAPASYWERIQGGVDPVEGEERLDRDAARLERIWQALRTTRGLSCPALASQGVGAGTWLRTRVCLARWGALGYLAPNGWRVTLSHEGLLHADDLAVELSAALDADGLDLGREMTTL